MMEDLRGRIFSEWEVLGPSKRKTTRSALLWWCRCSCGTEKFVNHYHLVDGASRSCRKCSSEKNTSLVTHGYTRDRKKKPIREYRVWKAMRDRCAHHPRYTSRNILVCEEWNSFEKFFEDMGRCPDGYSLDRIDNSKGYSKSNCRWASNIQQARNRTNNRILTFNGESLNVIEWAEKLGVSSTALYMRLSNGWSTERTLTQPVGVAGNLKHKAIYRGKEYSFKELSVISGHSWGTLHNRIIKLGWSVERAMNEPINGVHNGK